MAGATDVFSYPTHTRSSHPGWYSRLTYLHSYPEEFATYESGKPLDMFLNQFENSVNKKGTVQWPANYWKPGMHQRIKGLFLISGVADDRFDIIFGISDQNGGTIKINPNNGNHHNFKFTKSSIPVQFEFNIYLNHIDAGYPYFSIHGFYHYEDAGFYGDSPYNQSYHHIPLYGSGIAIDVTSATHPWMSFDLTSEAPINLRNLTIEELGG